MSPPPAPLPPLRPLDVRPGPLRRLAPRAFEAAAIGATFFGLAMLVVFFVTLGADVIKWFQVMPGLVREHNEKLAREAARARDQKAFLEADLKKIDEEMAESLRQAATPAEKDEVRRLFDEVREMKRKDADKTIQELLAAERGIRPDTSPPALLGHFFTSGPNSLPQEAGIWPALAGSLMLGLITLLFAVPVGVGAAVYLEEYKHSQPLLRTLQSIIQVNINNLAGVPAIMYGVLAVFAFVFLIFRPLSAVYPSIEPRNTLGGGLTLGLLTLPIIIVSAQEAIRAVPVSLRHASLALGATRWQTIARIVLPSSLPGILTGTILALSRALGEAACLVLFGALLFSSQAPGLFTRFTAMPLQVFGWSDRPAEVWRFNAAMGSAVLVLTVLALNGVAIYLRQRAQRYTRW